MRSSLFVLSCLLLASCESNLEPAPAREAYPGRTPLEALVERAAESDQALDRIRAQRVEGLPAARGGGPSSVYWPSQARESLAAERCRVLSTCGEQSDECIARESERLAMWPVDTCHRIVLDACLQSVRTSGCVDLDWKLSRECAPSSVCVGP